MSDAAYINMLMRQKRLKREDEKALVAAWQRSKDYKARDRLIMAYMPLVVKYVRRLGPIQPDLIHQGCIGLMRALNDYNIEGNANFGTYAYIWVREKIARYRMRGRSHLTFKATAMNALVFNNFEKQKRALGITDTEITHSDVERIANGIGCQPQKVIDVMAAVGGAVSIESDSFTTNSIRSNEPSPYEQCEANEIATQSREIVTAALESLKPKEREIFTRRYLQDDIEGLSTIAKDYGVTRQAISATCAAAMKKVERSVRARAA